MRIRIIVLGKIKEKWLQAGINEYSKRLSKYCRVNITEIEGIPDSVPIQKALEQEGAKIIRFLKPQNFCVALDLQGQQLDSVVFAAKMQDWFRLGGSEIVFIIGSSNGLAADVLKRAQVRLNISTMTFTHQMARLLLLEQCYRAFRINNKEPYHK